MKFGMRQKLEFSGVLMLGAIAVLAITVALAGIPALSHWTGINESYVTYIVAGICFFFAIFVSRAVRKLTAGVKK